jgi:hypothetical protein
MKNSIALTIMRIKRGNMAANCAHLNQATEVAPSAKGCECWGWRCVDALFFESFVSERVIKKWLLLNCRIQLR